MHNSLISMRVVLPEPLFRQEEKEEEEEVAACWLMTCAAELWAMVLPVSRQPVFLGQPVNKHSSLRAFENSRQTLES